MTPLPSQRTMPSARLSDWLGRHYGAGAGLASFLTATGTVIAALRLDVDPVKAITQLGIPVGITVCLLFALGWTFAIYVPRERAAQREELDRFRDVLNAERAAHDEREERLVRVFEESIRRIMEGVAELKVEVRTEIRGIREWLDQSGLQQRIGIR